MLCCFAADEKKAKDVGVEVAVELLFGDLIECAEFEDTSVVDENVELAEGLLRLSEETVDVSGLSDICLNGYRFASVGGDLGYDVFCTFAAGCIIDDDRGAFFGEFTGYGRPMPLEAPVTTATLPVSLPISFPSGFSSFTFR